MYGDGLVGFGMVLGGLRCFNGPHDGYANRSNSKTSLPRAKGWPYRCTDSSASRCRFTHDIWYPARCSVARKNEPEHGIKVGSKLEFDVFLAQSLYIRPTATSISFSKKLAAV